MKIRHRIAPLVAALSLAFAPIAQAQHKELLEYPSIHHPVVGERGMVAAQNAIAAKVGADILRQGGNAVDAAVATAFTLAVVLPRAGNIGGDGFMTIYDAKTNAVSVIDFRGVAPAASTLDIFVDANGHEKKLAGRGYLAPDVPGTVAGLWMAHEKFGKLPWATLVQPAIALARDGVTLSPDEAFVFGWGKDRLSTSAAALRTFYKPDGSPYKAGETLKQPDLAWSLGEIAARGADAFYKGAIADKLVADVKAHGGIITKADLANYSAVLRQPLVGSYRGYTIYTAPPSSAGGATLINMLNILEHFDLKKAGVGSAKELHLLAETMKLAYNDRYRFLGDPAFVKAPLAGFTSKGYGAARAKLIDQDKARPADAVGPGNPWAFESKQTTHFSVVDASGDAVSTTFTLGADFGSGVMVDGAGFLLNNEMNNFDHEYAWRARRDRKPPPLNAMQPGKRMLSTMMPTIVFKDGKPWLVTGSPGGSTIIDTVLQVIVDAIDFDLNVDEAVHQPRIFQNASDTLKVEPNFNPDTVANLKAMGHHVVVGETMGSVQSIMIEHGLYLGAADPRRPGAEAIAP